MKKIFLYHYDGTWYDFGFTPILLDDNGVNRIKFQK